MEQENNATNGRVDTPVVEPEQDKMMAKPVVEDNEMATGANEKKKGGNGMLIGLVLCVIAAVAGIGFGVWAMMDGNSQKDNYEKRISSLKSQINELQNKETVEHEDTASVIENDNSKDSDSGVDADSGGRSQSYSEPGSFLFATEGNPRISIMVKNSSLSRCYFETDNDRNGSWDTKECALGVVDGIYKAISFGPSHDADPYVGFIMKDGSVKYFSFFDAMNKNEYTLKTLNLDGKVVDSLKMTSDDEGGIGGYVTNVFVLDDGTFVKFDNSMVTQ